MKRYELYTKPSEHPASMNAERLAKGDIIDVELVDVEAAIEAFGWCGCFIPNGNDDGSDARCAVIEMGDPLPDDASTFLSMH